MLCDGHLTVIVESMGCMLCFSSRSLMPCGVAALRLIPTAHVQGVHAQPHTFLCSPRSQDDVFVLRPPGVLFSDLENPAVLSLSAAALYDSLHT